ncbi:MAG: hypothetical protein ACRD5G_02865, partial [Candidatus Acidiferrales bacterium]
IRLTERVTVEPYFEIFNVFNIANYQSLTSVLDGSAGSINGTVQGAIPARVGAGSGSFSSGIPRALQFGVRVSF